MSNSITVPKSWPLSFGLPNNASQIALLMIDFQGDFCSNSQSFIAAMGADDVMAATTALQKAKSVLHAARQAGVLIIHTLEAHRPDLSDLSPSKNRRSRPAHSPETPVIGVDGGNGRMLVRGSPCNGLMPEVAFIDGEVAIHKPGKGAFYNTELLARLQAEGVSHIMFAGVTTECCVQTTMREANDRGFTCLIVEDATASVVESFHQQTIEQITAFGAIVGSAATSVDVVEAFTVLINSNLSIPPTVRSDSASASPFPVIDVLPLITQLVLPFSAARDSVDSACLSVAKQIDLACRTTGFFYVKGHGLEPPFEQARQLFALDTQAKTKLRATAGEGAGYEPSGAQVLDEGRLGDGIDGMVKLGDRKESFIVGKSAPSQRIDSSCPIEGRWPHEGVCCGSEKVKTGFRRAMIKYHDASEHFLRTLLRGCALGLGLAADTFDCFTQDAMTKLRLLRYPSPKADPSYSQGVHGCGSHQDWGALTLLAQDDVGGLEVFYNGQWLPAPNLEGSLLINVGDMLHLWTAGRYRSSPHRVVKPKDERHSIAFFYNCDSDAPIDPRVLFPNKDMDPGQCCTAEQYILERVQGTYE